MFFFDGADLFLSSPAYNKQTMSVATQKNAATTRTFHQAAIDLASKSLASAKSHELCASCAFNRKGICLVARMARVALPLEVVAEQLCRGRWFFPADSSK